MKTVMQELIEILEDKNHLSNPRNNQDDIDTYSEFYHGGHEHSVSAATKAALIAGGVGVTEANFTAQ